MGTYAPLSPSTYTYTPYALLPAPMGGYAQVRVGMGGYSVLCPMCAYMCACACYVWVCMGMCPYGVYG